MKSHFRNNKTAFSNEVTLSETVADGKTKDLSAAAENFFEEMLNGPDAPQWIESEDDVAKTIYKAILSEKPQLRYQTSDRQKAVAKSKLVDPIGDAYVDATNKMFFSKK